MIKEENMFRKGCYIFALLATGILLAACGMDETSSGEPGSTRTIYGTSQKGPFVKGTEVTLYGMDEILHQTGAHFSTKVNNNKGDYSLKKINLEDRYAWLNANGYYIDEMTGEKSAQKISLNSLVDLQDLDHVNINVLTHLAFDRIRYLVKQGKPVDEAKRQAEKEVMVVFGFSEETEAFDQLDILGNGEDDAKLLAISLIMLTARDMGEITDRLATIALDIETDGVLDDTTLMEQTKRLVSMYDNAGLYDKARQNLIDMDAIEIPDFKKYIKLYIASWDSTWEQCNRQDEIVYKPQIIGGEIDQSQKYICRDGVWKKYIGFREVGKPPVDTAGKYGSFVDERDGRVYRTLDVKLKNGDTVTWMASLLEYEPKFGEREWGYGPGLGRYYSASQLLNVSCDSCRAEDGDQSLSEENIKGICPDGWHLPRLEESMELTNAIEDDYEARELLVYLQYEEDVFHGVDSDEDVPYYGILFDYYAVLSPYGYGDGLDAWNIDGNANVSVSWINGIMTYPVRCIKD